MFSSDGSFSSLSSFLNPAFGVCPFLTGYAVTAGHFSHPSTTDVVGGAPQDEGIGKVRRRAFGIAGGQTEGGGGAHCGYYRGLSPHLDLKILLGGRQVSDEVLRHLCCLLPASFGS